MASITPAFPQISTELNIPAESVSLLIIVFTLPGIFMILPLGIAADRFGRKIILIPSLFLFGISGLLCFFVRDFGLLLILRFFQGAGAASLGALNIIIIGDAFSGEMRAKAMGYNSSVLSIATASYPAIGGGLALFGWHYPFLLPAFAVPIGIAALLKLDIGENHGRSSFKNYFKNSLHTILEKRSIILFITSLITFIVLYGTILLYFPFLMHERFGSSSFEIGLFLSLMSIATAIFSLLFGKMRRRIGSGMLLKTAFLFYTVALVIIPMIDSIYLLIVPMILFGMGQGFNIPSIQLMLTEIAPKDIRGLFMSLNGMLLRLGQTLGPLIMAGVFQLLQSEGTFYAGAAISFFNFLLLLLFI